MTGYTFAVAMTGLCACMLAGCGSDPSDPTPEAQVPVQEDNGALPSQHMPDPPLPPAFRNNNPMDGRACLQCPERWSNRAPRIDRPAERR